MSAKPIPLSGTSPPQSSPSFPSHSKSREFRFKSKRTRSSSSSNTQDHKGYSLKHHHRHRRHHHRRSRRSASPAPPPVSPTTAFRESLFDALADDEGAAFWEGVYGQPIHTYSPYTTRANNGGELEQMDDEEYVAHVRAKMWEKSHAYVVEERRRREERREAEKKRIGERKIWQMGVEEALRRGEDRREKAKWKACWERYLQSWEEATRAEESKRFRDRMLWPTSSGRLEDVEKEEVERFFRNAPQPIIAEAEANTWAILKAERVRWHPDKVQQKFGSHGIDDAAMRTVTAIFQIVDRMWSEARSA